MNARQLALPLQWRPSRLADDFAVGTSNHEAVSWLQRGSTAWGHHGTVLTGPEKSGKSHLASLFAERFAAHVGSARVTGDLHRALAHASGAVVVDDLGPGLDEAALFHLYNAVQLNGGALLMVARTLPRLWPIALPDLASRLDATPKISVQSPDDVVLGAVFAKHLRDLGWSASPEVISFVVPRMERSFVAAHALAQALHLRGEGQRRDLTVPLAAAVLKVV